MSTSINKDFHIGLRFTRRKMSEPEVVRTVGCRLRGKVAEETATYSLILFLNVSFACNLMLIFVDYISDWSVFASFPCSPPFQPFTSLDFLRNNPLAVFPLKSVA